MIKIIIILFSIFLRCFINYLSRENCITIGPGGISGFWYYTDKIKKYDDNEIFTCSSSGCLAVISKNINFNYTYKIAKKLKYSNEGFEKTKNNFIYSLVNNIEKIPKINIITMDFLGNCISNVPENKKKLVELLILTTNVPILTKTKNRIDGGLCHYFYNYCNRNLDIPFNYRFIRNIFNTNMELKDVIYFKNYNNSI